MSVLSADGINTNDSFFQELDAGFTNNLRDSDNLPYLYKTTDLLVHQAFELPIPATAGSILKYKFTTEIGDIGFSVTFHAPGRSAETIIEWRRVPSNVEPIMGSMKAGVDGTYIFLFDNTFSWFNPKLLSYAVELHQVSFSSCYF